MTQQNLKKYGNNKYDNIYCPQKTSGEGETNVQLKKCYSHIKHSGMRIWSTTVAAKVKNSISKDKDADYYSIFSFQSRI